MEEATLIARVARGESLGAEDELPAGYRGELMRLMVVFVDSELAGAAGFADHINRAPGLAERCAAARIVSEKFQHAEMVLTLLARFGVNPRLYVRSHPWSARLDRALDLGNRRVGGDKRLNVFHYPLEGWVDAVAMNMLMGTASAIQLEELCHCSYAPFAAAMSRIVPREAEHAARGEIGLAQAIARDGALAAAQAAVPYWYPRVAATFGRLDSARFELYRRYGLRKSSNAELLARWESEIGTRLERLGLKAPAQARAPAD
ncbi:MAG TPA: Phenylacetic acid catabolic protein [Alphaproteobacteria bacterium]|nr:Phenylacetic acid catabolic protein [Alphaproteobacteria bacterium]